MKQISSTTNVVNFPILGGILYTLKILLNWILGLIVTAIIMASLSDEKVDWELVVTLSIAGFIGVFISSVIKKALRKEED